METQPATLGLLLIPEATSGQVWFWLRTGTRVQVQGPWPVPLGVDYSQKVAMGPTVVNRTGAFESRHLSRLVEFSGHFRGLDGTLGGKWSLDTPGARQSSDGSGWDWGC